MRIDHLPQPATLEPGAVLYRDLTPDAGEIAYRKMTTDLATIDKSRRTVEVSFSSDAPVKRPFGTEVLDHSVKAIDNERMKEGLPLLWGHDQDQPIGRVQNIRLKDGKLRGLAEYANHPRALEIFEMVAGGFLKDHSLGYRINAFEEDGDIIRATDWTPVEVSVVSVGADPSVGAGRAAGAGAGLALRNDGDGDGGPQLVASNDLISRSQEMRRRRDISDLFAPYRHRGKEFRELETQCRDDLDCSFEGARRVLYKLFSGDPQPLAGDYLQAEGSANSASEQFGTRADGLGRRVEFVRDNGADYIVAAADALQIRGNLLVKDPHPGAADLVHKRVLDHAIFLEERAGRSTRGLSSQGIFSRALISHGTSDFASLLEDVATKSLLVGFNEQPATHRLWTRDGQLPDFKTGKRVALSDFDDLEIVYENGEYKYGSFGDTGQSVSLATYGKLFSISRQALINDDVAAFTAIPAGMSRAALRTEEDLVYAILTGGVTLTMPDGNPLFDAATHSNYVAGGAGGVPSVATLNAGWTAMATQTGPKGAILNITPRFLVVPQALMATSQVLVASLTDPAGATVNVANPFVGKLEVVADARIDADDAAKWFLAADPGLYDTVEVATLNGQRTPFLETQNGWSTDGTAFKVRHDVAAVALDWRGLYHNDGN